MDATLVEAQVKRPPMSAAWREEHEGPRCGLEPHGSWITEHLLQGDIGVDEGTGLVAWRY